MKIETTKCKEFNDILDKKLEECVNNSVKFGIFADDETLSRIYEKDGKLYLLEKIKRRVI